MSWIADPGNIEFNIPRPPEIHPQLRHDAQKTVCRYALDAQEAAQLMMMIGIHPTQNGTGHE